MFDFLKNHPFAVEAFFENSIVLTFAVPKEQLQNMIPECLQLDLLNDQWAFIAVALVKTKNLKPKGFPGFLGSDFFLIGYRVFVRYTNNAGKNLRGLYILKSETDQLKMQFFGNIFTHYSYSTTDIAFVNKGNQTEIKSVQSEIGIVIERSDSEIKLPEQSPFTDWKEARKFAGPLPFTFTVNAKNKTILIIEGVRENWLPQPVKVIAYRIAFLNQLNLQNVVLANAFSIENIPYMWKKGRIEKWNN